jgi:dTDP-4-amino-4,6-dideoxygalactose transaminase
MTDLQAAIGQVELDRYPETLARRKAICEAYQAHFEQQDWALCPLLQSPEAETSYHLYMLRVDGLTEAQRDQVINGCYERGVSVNVHFQPLPLLTAYRERGYTLESVPNACNLYRNEISLPVYFDLTDTQVQTVCNAVTDAVNQVLA